MRSKGQVFSADAIIGLVIFMIALGVVFYYFSQLSQRELAFNQEFEMKDSAFRALAVLSETPGIPENWAYMDSSGIRSFGIAERRGILSSERLSALCALVSEDYNHSRKILGLKKFDVLITVSDLNGDVLESCGRAGRASSGPSFKTSRLSLLNSRPCIVSLEVFK